MAEKNGDVAACQKPGAAEPGLGGDGVDLGKRLELLIQEAPPAVADRARLRLTASALYPHQDVDHLRQAAIGDLEEEEAWPALTWACLSAVTSAFDLGADGERGGRPSARTMREPLDSLASELAAMSLF
ncbi:MAG: hypothetical protein R3C69_07825 [Geminicoccaceae bacterium]